jgi:Uma2 family endonuclease
MTSTIALPEQRVVLENVSWETYERLLAENRNSGTRFAYDDGTLEIMVVYIGHETPNRTLALIVELVAAGTGRQLRLAGSTTIKRQDLKKGIEPDTWFYLDANAALMRTKKELDAVTDPPPDLAIEIDMTRSSLSRFPIFAPLGITEVWRFNGERVLFYKLDGAQYREVDASGVLPPMTRHQADVFVAQYETAAWGEWIQGVLDWARTPL